MGSPLLVDILFPSFSVRSSGGGLPPSALDSRAVSDSTERGGRELLNHTSGKSRSDRTCANARWGVTKADGRRDKDPAEGLWGHLSPRERERRGPRGCCILIRLMVTEA